MRLFYNSATMHIVAIFIFELDQPLYSPDLAPSGCFLKLKAALKKRRFNSDEEGLFWNILHLKKIFFVGIEALYIVKNALK